MVSFPKIQIYRQHAKLGINSAPASIEIKQPKAAWEMTTTPAKLDIHSPRGDLRIDQSKAWEALGMGGHLEWAMRIYSASRDIALQAIARIVDQGNQLAAIHKNSNAIADIAVQASQRTYHVNYAGPASYDNVDIQYTARKPDIEIIEGELNIHTRPNTPEINYIPGRLEVYMLQYPEVKIIPPQIDMKV